MSETETLVRFFRDWHTDGETSEDGLPIYQDVVKIVLARPPLLKLERVAEESEFEEFPLAYQLFLKEDKATNLTKEAGYPLSHWPACNGYHVKMLASRDIYTVEQLSKLATRKADVNIPGEIRDLAQRAQAMIAMQKSGAKYEARVTDLERQLEVLKEDLKEAQSVINSQKDMINTLRTKAA